MELNKIDSICRDCVFAKYDNNIQVNCEVDKLSVFKAQGCEIEEVADENNGPEYFYIHDKLCNSFRTPDWIANIQKNFKVDKFEALKKEQSLYYTYILKDDGGDINDLINRIKELEQAGGLKYIGLILKNNTKIDINLAIVELQALKIQFKIVTLIDDYDYTTAFDSVVQYKHTTSIIIGSLVKSIPFKFIKALENDIYRFQKFIGYAEYEDYIFIMRIIYNYFQGWHFDSKLKEKIAQEHQYVIGNYDSINSVPE